MNVWMVSYFGSLQNQTPSHAEQIKAKLSNSAKTSHKNGHKYGCLRFRQRFSVLYWNLTSQPVQMRQVAKSLNQLQNIRRRIWTLRDVDHRWSKSTGKVSSKLLTASLPSQRGLGILLCGAMNKNWSFLVWRRKNKVCATKRAPWPNTAVCVVIGETACFF